jgi:predicted dehydrogenase
LSTPSTRATAASPRSWEQTSGENAVYAHCADEDCYVLSGTRGTLGVPTMRLRRWDGEASWTRPFHTDIVPGARHDPLERQLAHFCAVARRECAPSVDGREGLETLRVTLAIARAAATGTMVTTARESSLAPIPQTETGS